MNFFSFAALIVRIIEKEKLRSIDSNIQSQD